MENRMLRRIFLVVAMSGIPALSMAQEQVSPAEVGNRALSQVPNLTMAQLSDLVAPIALYPDALLSQVLVASTYPLEVVQAHQWLRRNELLQGQRLMDAARQQPWDASVQARARSLSVSPEWSSSGVMPSRWAKRCVVCGVRAISGTNTSTCRCCCRTRLAASR